MCPASRARPSERSSIAVATRASRLPSSTRIGTGGSGRSRNAAPAAPSGPVTTTSVAGPGAGAARHPLRSGRARSRDRTTRVGAGRVAAAHRHAALVQALVELEHVVELGLRRDASETSSASGSAPEAARSLTLTAAARAAELAPAERGRSGSGRLRRARPA